MPRWQEMLMDYGQVLDQSLKSKSNSDFFSVDGDLEERHNLDLELRHTLEVHFRPMFQRFVYGGEKIACHDLKRVLTDPEHRSRLPVDKVHELADLADFNQGRAVSYTEFVRIVLGQNMDELASFGSQNELSSPRSHSRKSRALAFICRNTQAQQEVEDHVIKYRFCPPPFFMIAITIAQIVVYALYVDDDVDNRLKALEGVADDNDLMYLPSRRRQAWRFFSYCLLHQGFVPLIINAVLQITFGVPLEIMFSFWRLAIVYICGVLAGSLGQSVSDSYVGLVGAAGGTNAVMVAHVVAMIQNWSSLNNDPKEKNSRRVLCSVSLRTFLICLLVLTQVGLAVYRRWGMDSITLKTGIGANVGGIVAGILLSRAFLTDRRLYPWQAGAGWLGIFTYLFLVGACVVFNIVYNDYPNEIYS